MHIRTQILVRFFRRKKSNFDMKNIGTFRYVLKTYRYVGTKATLKGWKSGLFVNFD